MLSFVVFILIVIFASIYICLVTQVKRMTLAGKKVVSHMPRFLILKLSDGLYLAVNMVFGWILIILGGMIANSGSDPLMNEFPGVGWGGLYFFILSLVYGFLWLKNRSVDLKKS